MFPLLSSAKIVRPCILYRDDFEAHPRGLVRRTFHPHNGSLLGRGILAGRGGHDHVAIRARQVRAQGRIGCGICPGKGSRCIKLEYASPRVGGKSAALRLDSLLDRLADKRYEPLREVVVKMLAFSVWRDHPDVKKIRATFGAVSPPGISDFENGKAESFQPMFSYDFSLRGEEKQ